MAAHCDARSLLIVRNTAGTLDAKPLLEKPLAQNATNAIRKLYQINKVETAAAMMNEVVLVPEGRFDFDWLSLLQRIADLDRDIGQPCFFGARVGVIPTSDAKVKETCVALAKAHPNVVALVDGDADGIRYADSFDEEGSAAVRVLRWPDGWTIEDVISWIIEVDAATVLARLNQDLADPPGDRATLLARLKSPDRGNRGLKGDGLAYEIVANALLESAACRRRTRAFLHAVFEACEGKQTDLFNVEQRQARVPRLVFTP